MAKNSDSRKLWFDMIKLELEINNTASLFSQSDKCILVANSKSKTGEESRKLAKEAFKITQVNSFFLVQFLEAKKELDSRRLKISELQAQQKNLSRK